MCKTLIHFFTIADFEEEEIWLREQHKKGLKLVKMIIPCFYIFEECEPEDVIYRLDYQNIKPGDDYWKMLEDFAYRKIWDSLTQNERRIIRCMSEDNMKVEKLRQALNMSAGTFSKYREKMLKSGVITSTGHGYVSLTLPRFNEVTRLYHV